MVENFLAPSRALREHTFVSAQLKKGRDPLLMSWPLPYRSWECRLRKQGGLGG